MLEIINNLNFFFEDCYRRVNVREYAKLIKISPPTASKLLFSYHKEGLLKKEAYRNYLFFFSNKESKQFIDLSRMYWDIKLKEIVSLIEKKTTNPTIVLFGSLAKAEVMPNSDIDIAIFSVKKELNLKNFENILKRKIQLFWFNSLKDIENKELANNIANGYLLTGRLRL